MLLNGQALKLNSNTEHFLSYYLWEEPVMPFLSTKY
jgi:hypothetical protein